jgi:hypothetical protein
LVFVESGIASDKVKSNWFKGIVNWFLKKVLAVKSRTKKILCSAPCHLVTGCGFCAGLSEGHHGGERIKIDLTGI